MTLRNSTKKSVETWHRKIKHCGSRIENLTGLCLLIKGCQAPLTGWWGGKVKYKGNFQDRKPGGGRVVSRHAEEQPWLTLHWDIETHCGTQLAVWLWLYSWRSELSKSKTWGSSSWPPTPISIRSCKAAARRDTRSYKLLGLLNPLPSPLKIAYAGAARASYWLTDTYECFSVLHAGSAGVTSSQLWVSRIQHSQWKYGIQKIRKP